VTVEVTGAPAPGGDTGPVRQAKGAPAGTAVIVRPVAPATPYAGLATRTLAFALDAAIIDGVALFVAVTVGLGLSLLHLPKAVNVAIAAVGACIWILWSIGYFVFFWSTTGQTPGSRVMSIAVVDANGGGQLKPRRAALRLIALAIGAAALLSGIVVMLWDSRRRCFHDRVTRTLVLYVRSGPPAPPAAAA
jgi:uncharacterized RDD family membrane protein YckC